MKRKLINNITISQVNGMSYTDFIGLINQWNVPPGSYDTISRWSIFGKVSDNSRIFEIACTTGFSLREISILTGCSGIGVDLSEESIKSALFNKENYSSNLDIDYKTKNALEYSSSQKFTHVITGSGLGFFKKPQDMISRIENMLIDGGILLASPFFTINEIPQELVEEAKGIFGITVTRQNYKEIMSLYKDFEILYETRKDLLPETNQELDAYCKDTVDALDFADNVEAGVKEAMYKRLMEIKVMSNKLRPYQGYSVLVLRYRKSKFGKRFVEKF